MKAGQLRSNEQDWFGFVCLVAHGHRYSVSLNMIGTYVHYGEFCR